MLPLPVAVAALALWLSHPPAKNASVATTPREVPRADLVLREDQLFERDATAPFTGVMIERYRQGGVKSRTEVRDGRLDGSSEGWTVDGQLQVREHFAHGVAHGLRTTYHPNGHRRSEASIEHGKIQGTFRRWHDNDVLAEELPMLDSQPHGVARAFHPDGTPKSTVTLEHGQVVSQEFPPASSPTAPAAPAPGSGLSPLQTAGLP